jgi:cytochrome c556
MKSSALMIGVLLAGLGTAAAQQVPQVPDRYAALMKTIGKSGDFKDSVLKVNIPRTDLRVTIKGRPAPTPFGFGG